MDARPTIDRAVALPELGKLNAGFFSVEGLGYGTINLSLSRLIGFGSQHVELRLEAFNLLNNFNWGNPVTTLDTPTFGQIQTAAGDPRIMQFGFKYAF